MRQISAIQPTGNGIPHLGNYLGVLRHLSGNLNKDSYVFVADVHATTVPYKPDDMKQAIHNTTAMLMAIGIDRELIFQQSMVMEHFLLSTLLTHLTPLGFLERMTQYKVKKEQVGVLTGLLTYPTLMAADILLYDIDEVPVGRDQIQHVELARDIAVKFNNTFGEILKIPKFKVLPFSKVGSLSNGELKMSKSSPSQNDIIYLNDDMTVVTKKYKKATTDSFNGICPNGSLRSESVENLISILCSITGQTRMEVCSLYGDRGYGIFKKALIDAHEQFILPIKNEFDKISAADVDETLKKGSSRATEYASNKMTEIKSAMGL